MQSWPEPDQAAWARASFVGGPLDEPGDAAGFSPETTRSLLALYGAYLAWLDREGELERDQGPETRFTFDRVGRFVRARRETVSDNTVFNNLGMLAMMMNCLVPEKNWNWIRRHPLAPNRAEARAARRPQPVFDPGRLLHRLLAEYGELRRQPLTRDIAWQIRDLVMLAVAFFSGVRRGNLLGLRVGHNLLRLGGRWEVLFEADETKADVPIASRLPVVIEAALEFYLDACRPLLLAGRSDTGLAWISLRGRKLSESGCRSAFARLGTRLLSDHLHPHEVRHVMATTLLTHRPNGIDVAAAALTHKGTATVIRHYDQSGATVAQAVWRQVTSDLRGTR